MRYFSFYGPRQRSDMVYRIFSERLRRGQPIIVFGDGGQSRSNTYVTDCVSATMAGLEGPRDGSVFNIGGGQEIKLLDSIAILARHLDVDPVIEYAEARRGDQRRTAVDITKAREMLNWKPTIEPEQGLLAEVRWVQEPRAYA